MESSGGLRKSKKAKEARKVQVRKIFNKKFKDELLQDLIFKKEGGKAELLKLMKKFKEDNKIVNLKKELNMIHTKDGRKEIVDLFEGILKNGLPDKETYLEKMDDIKKKSKDISISNSKLLDDYDSIQMAINKPVPQSQQEIEVDSSGGGKSASMSDEEKTDKEKFIKIYNKLANNPTRETARAVSGGNFREYSRLMNKVLKSLDLDPDNLPRLSEGYYDRGGKPDTSDEVQFLAGGWAIDSYKEKLDEKKIKIAQDFLDEEEEKDEKMLKDMKGGLGAGADFLDKLESNPNVDPKSGSSSTSKSKEEMEEEKEEMKEESKVEMKEEMKVEGSHTMPDGTKMSGKTHSKNSRPIKEEPFVLPTRMDSIPPSRLSSSFKSVEDLNDDIKYFLKNFGNLLKSEKGIYKKIGKNDKPNLIKLHSRIVGKLSPKIPKDMRGKKVGVVLDAQEYIRSEMKRLMENNSFSSMSPGDVVIDVGYNDKVNDPNVKDFGDFEVKRNSEGGLSSRREGIYRYAPTEGNEDVGLEDVPERKKRKPRRLANIPLKEINEATTAKRMVRRNPFARNVKTIKLKYLY